MFVIELSMSTNYCVWTLFRQDVNQPQGVITTPLHGQIDLVAL